MNEKFRTWHNITLFSYIGLIITIITWYFIVSPPQYTLSVILSVSYVVILLLPAYGLIKKTTGAYMWSSYLMLIYFSHGIIETWANADERGLALLELILSSLYFVAATMSFRYSRQLNKQKPS